METREEVTGALLRRRSHIWFRSFCRVCSRTSPHDRQVLLPTTGRTLLSGVFDDCWQESLHEMHGILLSYIGMLCAAFLCFQQSCQLARSLQLDKHSMHCKVDKFSILFKFQDCRCCIREPQIDIDISTAVSLSTYLGVTLALDDIELTGQHRSL